MKVQLATTIGLCAFVAPALASDEGSEIFRPSRTAETSRTETFGRSQLGRWSVEIDRDLLLTKKAEANAREGTARRPIVGQDLNFSLPDGSRRAGKVDSVFETIPGVFTFSGTFNTDSKETFSISLDDNAAVGSIRLREDVFLIESDAGSTTLTHLDRALMPLIPDEVIDGRPALDPLSERAATTLTGGKVDILFLHASDVSNASLRANDIVARTNVALANSLVPTTNFVWSVGVQPINSTFPGQTRTQIMIAMNGRQPPFSNLVWDRMFHAKADMAFLLIQEDPSILSDNYGLWGRAGGVAGGVFNPARPFALSTDDYALGDNTGPHEIGHVLGGDHEDVSDYRRGKVSATGAWMTIMGGYASANCQFNGLSPTCQRIDYFSNPNIMYGGEATGEHNSRDMASWLAVGMPAASQWGDGGDLTAPAAPSAIWPTSGDPCQINWSAVTKPGATITYRLYQSTWHDFVETDVVYTGPATSQIVTLPMGPMSQTQYFRVRACAESVCSNPSDFTSSVRSIGLFCSSSPTWP